jgi:hypothetical protein
MADHAHLDQPADGEIAHALVQPQPEPGAAISHEGTDVCPTSISGPMAGARRVREVPAAVSGRSKIHQRIWMRLKF